MKERLDVLLVKRGLAESREKAKAIIMSGIVYVEDQKEDKAGTTFDENAKIEVRGSTLKYVSRGGLKLEKAMTHFGVTLDQKVCMDVGASTGGFTDCMLQNGAVKVFSVDVGHGQLAWKLRNDPRVVCMEKTNIRYVTPEDIGEPVDFSSIDVSFISLTKVLGPVKEILSPGGEVVALIKPQFEAGREKVGKKGVVREKSTHLEVIQMVMAYAAEIGFEIRNLEFSPIKGPEGNIEYLLYLHKPEPASEIFRSEGMMTQILTPFECGSMTKLFSKDRANKYFSKGMVVFFAGGTGHPYFSTDTGVALRAIEMDADCILLAKAIDGVYDSDPKINPDAKKYDTITIQEVIDKQLAVVDLTASIMCMENHVPMAANAHTTLP